MEWLTAFSTLIIAIFTVALVILAGANFKKFVENVRLIADSVSAQNESLKAQTKSIDLQSESLKSQTKSIDLQATGIKEQIRSIELQADSLKAQAKALELQNKDIYLNYRPVVYIKGTIPPPPSTDPPDPYKYAFVLTNSGKLAARNVKITIVENISANNITVINSRQPVGILNKASIFPGSDLVFWVGKFISSPNPTKNSIEINFLIKYKGEGIDQEFTEKMRFINTPETSNQWIYVGPDVHVIKNTPKIPLQSGTGEISEGRINIISEIVDGILGIDFVINAPPQELIDSFSKISEGVRKNGFYKDTTLNGGGLTGLRSVGIINESDQLTTFGVSVFKRVAEHLKSIE